MIVVAKDHPRSHLPTKGDRLEGIGMKFFGLNLLCPPAETVNRQPFLRQGEHLFDHGLKKQFRLRSAMREDAAGKDVIEGILHWIAPHVSHLKTRIREAATRSFDHCGRDVYAGITNVV